MHRNNPQATFGYPSDIAFFLRQSKVSRLAMKASGFSFATLFCVIKSNETLALLGIFFAAISISASKQLFDEFEKNFGMNEFRGLEETIAQLPRPARSSNQFYVFSSRESLRNSFSATAMSTALITLAIASLFEYYVSNASKDQGLEIGAGMTGLIGLIWIANHIYSTFGAKKIDMPNNVTIERVNRPN